jgi:hypothetical protein
MRENARIETKRGIQSNAIAKTGACRVAKAGRPTKYRPEYCQAIVEYFSVEPTYEVPVTITFKNGTEKESTEERPTQLRFLSNFADSIGVDPDTLLEWCRKHKEFSGAYTRAKALQKQHLVTCGLLGLYNSKFAVFTACNITDMRNKEEHTHGVTDGLADLMKEIGAQGTGLPIKEGG